MEKYLRAFRTPSYKSTFTFLENEILEFDPLALALLARVEVFALPVFFPFFLSLTSSALIGVRFSLALGPTHISLNAFAPESPPPLSPRQNSLPCTDPPRNPLVIEDSWEDVSIARTKDSMSSVEERDSRTADRRTRICQTGYA
jgi:hypothetical protein